MLCIKIIMTRVKLLLAHIVLFIVAALSLASTNQPPQNLWQKGSPRIISRPITATASSAEWRPHTTAEESLQLAKTYIQQEKIDISSCYLAGIKLDATWKMVGSYKQLDQQFWTLLWVEPVADHSASVVICVSMDGKKTWRADVAKDVIDRDEHLSKAPVITLDHAMQIANEHIYKENIDMSNYYLHKVALVDSRGYWYFWWTNGKGILGDYVEITVSMDGKAARMCSM